MSPWRTAATVGVLLALTACTSSPSDTPDPAASPDRRTSTSADPEEARRTTDEAQAPTPPAARDCHRLTFKQVLEPSNDTAPVPCGDRHNAVTIHVGELDTAVAGNSVAEDSAAVLDQISTTCPRKLASYLGGDRSTRALSRFEVVWFTPTVEQSDAGADWFRCDLIAFAGHEHLAPLPRPRRLNGVLDDGDTLDTYGLCGTADPGAARFARVICSEPHAWRATSTISIDGGAKYPGARSVRNAGEETCRDRVRAIADSSLKFPYGWEWPTKDQWRRGQHYGYCWAPD